MPNTKTGTTWAPDIRPESIETFTETYTPEGGEEQTVTYKRVADHPILNGIRDKLAFFMTHAGAVWYNKQANRTVADEIGELKAKMEMEYIDVSDLFTPGPNCNITNKQAYRIGKQITYHFAVTCTTSIRYGTIISIDESILPKTVTNAFCAYQKNGYGVLAQCNVTKDNGFYVNLESGATSYNLYGTYFIE